MLPLNRLRRPEGDVALTCALLLTLKKLKMCPSSSGGRCCKLQPAPAHRPVLEVMTPRASLIASMRHSQIRHACKAASPAVLMELPHLSRPFHSR